MTAHMMTVLETILAAGGYQDRLLHSGRRTASHPLRKVDMSRAAAAGYVKAESVRDVCTYFVTAQGCSAYNAATIAERFASGA